MKRLVTFSGITGFLFSTTFILGYQIKNQNYTARTIGEVFINLFWIFLLTIPCTILIGFFLEPTLFKKYLKKNNDIIIKKNNSIANDVIKHKTNKTKIFLFYWLLIFLCFMPFFLAYYPGICNYDYKYQIAQVITGDYKTHHPLLHTLFMGLCYTIGEKIYSYTFGIAIYTLIQMVVVSGSFAYSISFLAQKGLGRKGRIATGLFYGLFPVFPMLAISTTKDVLFGAIFLIVIIHLFKMIHDEKKSFYYMLFWGILLTLLRNNGIYALLSAMVLLIIFNRRKWKEWILLFIGFAVGYVILNGLLMKATQAADGNLAESLSVPLQQIARVACYEGDDLTIAQKEEITYFIPTQAIKEYNGYVSDGIKGNADATKIRYEAVRFLKLWFQLGMKKPLVYVDAFLTNTMGYWYLGDEVHSIIYGEGGYLLTHNQIMGHGYDVERKEILPLFNRFLQSLFQKNQYQKIPIFSFLLRPAIFFIFSILFVTAMLYQKKGKEILPMLLIATYYLTVFLGPIALIRYIYCIVACCPLLFGIYVTLLKSNDQKQ